MRSAWVIAKREVKFFFLSPIAYVVITSWLLWCGLTFYQLVSWFASFPSSGGSDTPLNVFFGGTTLFFMPLLVFSPLLTMRLLAEERSTGTIEPLLTSPISEASVVIGKYIAAVAFWIAMWSPTVLYAFVVQKYGDVDWGVIGASYLGILGIGLYYMAFGLLMNAVARNQIVAAVLTFVVLGSLFLIGLGELMTYDVVREIFAYVSVWAHMSSFSKGIVDTRYIVFDVSLAALAVFLTIRVLEARRYES